MPDLVAISPSLLANGRALTKESFGNEFKAACKAAGVPGSAHGVRKVAATTAANNGATEAQLMAIFGWTDPKMAALYTRTANRKQLAAEAMEKLSGTSIPAPCYPVRAKAKIAMRSMPFFKVVRSRGIEPPRAKPTAPSTLRVYHFRHDRLSMTPKVERRRARSCVKSKEFRSVRAPGYGYRLTLLQARFGCLSKPRLEVQGRACHADF